MALLPPLWVNLWGQQPFELSKAMLVRTLVWLLLALALADYVLFRRSLRRDLRSNPLLGPVSLLALVITVTTATAANWRLSLWGSYERAQGAATLLTYLLLFLLAVNQLRSLSRARHLVMAMAGGSIPLLLIGLLQAAGRNPLGLVSDARSPLYATLGRANFLGAYLAILTPLTLALLLKSQRRRCRVAWAVLLTGQVVVIGLTWARSAWLAVAVALSLFALLWWGSKLARRWRRLAWSAVVLLALSGPLLVLWLGQHQGDSAAARLTIWRATLELIGRRPLLGYGADALGVIFPGVYPAQLVYYQGRGFFVDRAHNLLLDWAVTAGVPGLLAFLLVLITFALFTTRALHRSPATGEPPGEQRAFLIAVLAAILGNAANNLTSFDVTATATATWLLMGLGLALTLPPPSQNRAAMDRGSGWRLALVGLLVLGASAAIWQLNGRPILADVAARAASRRAIRGATVEAIAAAEGATRQWPFEPAHHLLLSQTYWQRALADPAATSMRLPQAESALLAARQMRPAQPAIWLQTAEFYASAANRFASDTRALAHEAYGQALALAPNDATVYAAWGRAYLQENDPQAAAPLLRQAVRLDASHGQAYLYLAAAELALGRVEVALDAYEEAVRLLPASSQAYAGLARCYWQLGRPRQALLAAEEALRRDPHNTQAIAIIHAVSNVP